MDYLRQRDEVQQGIYPHTHADITRRLQACAGQIISRALTVDHVPQGARDLMANPLIHDFVRVAFRDVVVDCLAAYFDRLEESRREVLEAVVRETKSKYGRRLRLVQSAIRRMNNSPHYDFLNELEHRVTPEMYDGVIAVVRYEYTRA